jgi:hypothetical protein
MSVLHPFLLCVLALKTRGVTLCCASVVFTNFWR